MALLHRYQRKMEHNGLYTHRPTSNSHTFEKKNGLGSYCVYSHMHYCLDRTKPVLFIQENKSSSKCSETITTVKPGIDVETLKSLNSRRVYTQEELAAFEVVREVTEDQSGNKIPGSTTTLATPPQHQWRHRQQQRQVQHQILAFTIVNPNDCPLEALIL